MRGPISRPSNSITNRRSRFHWERCQIYEAAAASAEESGLLARRDTLLKILARYRESQEPSSI